MVLEYVKNDTAVECVLRKCIFLFLALQAFILANIGDVVWTSQTFWSDPR